MYRTGRRYRRSAKNDGAGIAFIIVLIIIIGLIASRPVIGIPVTCFLIAAVIIGQVRKRNRAKLAGPGQAFQRPAGEVRQREPIRPEVKRAVWVRDGGRCQHCGITDRAAVAATGRHLAYDHIIPFSKNGADTAGNLQLLCTSCNSRKGNRFTGLRRVKRTGVPPLFRK